MCVYKKPCHPHNIYISLHRSARYQNLPACSFLHPVKKKKQTNIATEHRPSHVPTQYLKSRSPSTPPCIPARNEKKKGRKEGRKKKRESLCSVRYVQRPAKRREEKKKKRWKKKKTNDLNIQDGDGETRLAGKTDSLSLEREGGEREIRKALWR